MLNHLRHETACRGIRRYQRSEYSIVRRDFLPGLIPSVYLPLVLVWGPLSQVSAGEEADWSQLVSAVLWLVTVTVGYNCIILQSRLTRKAQCWPPLIRWKHIISEIKIRTNPLSFTCFHLWIPPESSISVSFYCSCFLKLLGTRYNSADIE